MLRTFLMLMIVFYCRKVPSAHYSLKYNVMPYVGALTYGEAGRTLEPVIFPPAEESVA